MHNWQAAKSSSHSWNPRAAAEEGGRKERLEKGALPLAQLDTAAPGSKKELGPTRVWWHTGLKSETYTFLGLKN